MKAKQKATVEIDFIGQYIAQTDTGYVGKIYLKVTNQNCNIKKNET